MTQRKRDRGEERVCISTLPAAEKRAVWQQLQTNNPSLAEAIGNPQVQQVLKDFNATITIKRKLFEQPQDGVNK